MARKTALLEKTMLSTAQAAPETVVDKPARRHGVISARDWSVYGVPLSFRVPPELSKRFRLVAVQNGLKLNELFQASFELYLREAERGQ